ncbi:hypothetical protein ElyMa_005035400 [Elysia marginata]|uniref:Uncharacterized protein n=1 Tax=Elysia marginata TaxID=1093978 RepID=A0AAV4JCQ5_9GAST|nr:hypothetical protein ElyMa_005035400 [Elysia marginata]
MPPHAIFGLLAVFALLGTPDGHSVGRPEETVSCPPESFARLQETCQAVNGALLDAEFKRDRDGVCKNMLNVMWCVATHTKECFEMYQSTMEHYLHSPFSCQLTQEDVLKFQKVVYQTDHDDSHESAETTPDSAPQPWTNGQGEGTQHEGGGAEHEGGGAEREKGGTTHETSGTHGGKGVDNGKGYDIKTDSGSDKSSNKDSVGSQGTQEQHKGTHNDKDTGPRLASWSLWIVLVLALTSSRLPWRLIS